MHTFTYNFCILAAHTKEHEKAGPRQKMKSCFKGIVAIEIKKAQLLKVLIQEAGL